LGEAAGRSSILVYANPPKEFLGTYFGSTLAGYYYLTPEVVEQI
jgi:hypothetical protein